MSFETNIPTELSSEPGVLIVDDEQLIRNLLAHCFRLQGLRVYVAESGPEGVEIYRREQKGIDLVLLDIRMPGMDGPTTLAAIQQLDPGVRCCFMSGDPGNYSREDLLRMGSLRLFEKPLQLSELVETLKHLIGCPIG
jgi:DNA-binding NtrC family response regulator